MIIKSITCLLLYYGFARYLPCSYSPFLGNLSTKIRRFLCKRIFKHMGVNCNVERMAYFGNGKDVVLGDNSGIGINAHIYNNTIIGNDVMMAPNVYFLQSGHIFARTDIPMCKQGVVTESSILIIEDDCSIGQDVLVMGSKTIK